MTEESEATSPGGSLHDQADPALLSFRDFCLEQVARETDRERACRLHYDLGRLFEGPLRDDTRAAEHYTEALRLIPDHAAAVQGARRSLGRLHRFGELLGLYDAETRLTRDPGRRAQLLYEKARLLELKLGQPGASLAVYDEASALDPGNLLYLKALERGHRRERAWESLAGVLDRMANAVTDPGVRAVFLAQRAHLTETRLGDPANAIAYYEAAAEADPHATAALSHVKRLGVSQGRWASLASAMRREHQLTRDHDARHALLCSIARVQERHLNDDESAAATLEEALAAQPNDRSLLDELARLHGKASRYREQAQALARRVDLSRDPEEVATLCHRVARLHEEALGEGEAALRWYRRAHDADPRHRESATRLAALLEARDDYAAVLKVWATRAGAIADTEEQAVLHHRMGHILEARLGRPHDATAQYARAFGLNAQHHAAFVALCRLLAEASRWHELVELYGRAIDTAPPAEAKAWLFRMGGVLEDHLDDPRAALGAYERVLAMDPTDLGALHAIGRAAERAGRPERVVEALRAESDLAADPVRRDSLRHRAAMLVADALGDPWGADHALEAILEQTPTHRASLESLARLRTESGQWEALLGTLHRLLSLAADDERLRLHLRMGEIYEHRLAQDLSAIASYRAALELDADNEEASRRLRATLRRTEAWAELAAHEESRVPRIRDPRDRARAAIELATLYESRLADGPRALAAWELALSAMPNHRAALDARSRLLTDAQDWGGLARVLGEETAALDDPFIGTQAALRTAQVLSEQNRVGESLEAFRPVFTARADHPAALFAVEEIYTRADNASGLTATFQRMAQALKDPSTQLASLRALAEAKSAAGASDVWREVLNVAPEDRTALEGLNEFARRTGDTSTELNVEQRLAQLATDPTVAAHHRTRVGELLLAARDARGALEAYRAALSLDSRSLTATRGLSRAARAARDADAMAQAARYETHVTQDREEAVRLLLSAARLQYENDLEEAAATSYEEALALAPDHPEAAMGVMMTMMRADLAPRMVEVLTQAAHAASDPDRGCILHLCVAQLQADLRHDLPAAVAAARRAIEVRPNHQVAHDRLADYLERNEQWVEAVAAIERGLESATGRTKVGLYLRLAKIQERDLREPEKAKVTLRSVLELSAHDAVALTSLARLERLSGNVDEALRLVRSLLDVAEKDTARAAALAEMAELENGRGQPEAAAAAALSAIGIQGPRGSAARLYRGLVQSHPAHAAFEPYTQALLAYLERARRGRGDVAATYRELARVFGEASDPERAIRVLTEGTRTVPKDASISLALVRELRKAGETEQALTELRRVVDIDVLEVGAWRAFAEIAMERREPDAASVLAPLVALGQASPAEQQRVSERRPRVAAAPAGMLGKVGLSQLQDGGPLHESTATFLPALLEILTKIEGIDHERWGVSKRERIRVGDLHPVRNVADRIGHVFGVPEFDLYVVDGRTKLARSYILAGSPPALLVPAHIERASEPALAFHLARPMALLSQGLHPLDHIDDATMERILVAAVRQFQPTFTLDPFIAEEDLEAEVRRVGKAVGFFSKGRLQEAVAAFAAAPPQSYATWAKEVRRLATRAALLIADDLGSTLKAVGEDVGPDNYASDLVRFWVSDPAMRFRRALHR